MSETAAIQNLSDAFAQQRADMELCHNLMGGTDAMIEAGELYIPREEGEDNKSWQIRLKRTILFNVYKRTLRYLCGRVFEKQVSIEEIDDNAELNDKFQAFTEDVDHMGDNLTVWSRKAFESGLNDGVTFTLVDYDRIITRKIGGAIQYLDKEGQWRDKTIAEDELNGWGPYLVLIEAGQVLGAHMEWRYGRPVITRFRYIEDVEKPDGLWGTVVTQRIRGFYLDDDGRAVWEVWENDNDGNWTLTDSGIFSIGAIPVCIFMPGEKRSYFTAEPALIDLAQLNKRHWQATSSHYELMEYVRRPPWFAKCLGEFDPDTGRIKIIFGPGKLCHSTNEAAFLQSVGVDPQSVAASRQELGDIENRMAIYGMQLLQPKTGAITATESLRDSEENNSTLKAWALQFQDFLENCFKLVAKWLGMRDGPGVVVNTQFANALDASLLLDLFRAQAISGETFLKLAKGMGILPDDFVIEDEAAKIASGLMANNTGATELADMFKSEL